MNAVESLQSYMRENARSQYEALPLPPFTLFFHPYDPLTYFNYAIPDHAPEGDLSGALAVLQSIFLQRERVPRFEFFEAYAPELPGELLQAGFIEESRQWTMTCTPETLLAAPAVNDLSVTILGPDSPTTQLRDYVLIQRQVFDAGNTTPPNEQDILQARQSLATGQQGFVAHLNGKPAGAATLGRIIAGASEITGIATLLPFRRRGIAAWLTWLAAREAFRQGAHVACLTAADENAGRVYTRAGFQPTTIMLAFIKRDGI